ncbi:hypothetical protein P4V41_02965 [Fictibacillus nanhaiensis]|uniref:hypothetical protein n=1 Tax=Fictibacillus nanhaiensis TaxID=742169 RepID=UPI002E231D86|nr:hypothetical protein [Fictibacillus nanhaiensis]
MEFQNWNSSDKRSLIEIKDIKCPPYHGPREGYWYKLNRNFWEDFEFDFEKYSFEQKNKSLIFRVSATYKPKEECNFYSYKVANIDEK